MAVIIRPTKGMILCMQTIIPALSWRFVSHFITVLEKKYCGRCNGPLLLSDLHVRHLPIPVMYWEYNAHVFVYIIYTCLHMELCINIYIYMRVSSARSLKKDCFTLVLRHSTRLHRGRKQPSSSI